MFNRTFWRYFVFIGLLAFFLPFFHLANPPKIGLDVISILFGGLLTIAGIIPAIYNFKKIREIGITGHLSDLRDYISFPLFCSFILLVIELVRSSISSDFSLSFSYLFVYIDGIILAIWGIFILGVFRLLTIIPLILLDYSK